MNLSQKAIVKSVLSGDSIVIRGKPVNGPPPEKIVSLAYITAPRPNKNFEEPFSFEAKEFLRKRLVGKEIEYSVEFVSTNGRENILVEDVVLDLLSAGLVKLRQNAGKEKPELLSKLQDAETKAKEDGVGLWSSDIDIIQQATHEVKQVSSEELPSFVAKSKGHQLQGIVEQVRDGSTLRVLLLPEFQLITLFISGIKAPACRQGIPDVPDLVEPFGEEAKFFVESRLLQREVKVIVEGLSNNGAIGSVLHPAGNIAQALVSCGLAKVFDSSIAVVTGGPKELREAERKAQASKLRLWQNYVAPSRKDSESFEGEVIKIISGDTVLVEKKDGSEEKITLSSIRQPRKEEAYYINEARDYLRSKLIGQKVSVHVEYKKPATQGFEARTCGTVFVNKMNVAEALLNKGLAYVIFHKKEDSDRSRYYDQLLVAHEKAQKEKKGIYSVKEQSAPRIVDASETAAKARSFLPFFKRAGRIPAVVEYVINGNCMKLLLKKDNTKITFIIAGVRTPRKAKAGSKGQDEPFAEEALKFVSRKIFQRDVEVEIDDIDKNGSFLGSLFINEKENLGVLLLQEGLAYVTSFSAKQNPYSNQLTAAENSAKSQDLKVWKIYNEEAAKLEKDTVVETAVPIMDITISDVISAGHFCYQVLRTGESQALEELMNQLNSLSLYADNSFKVNDLVAAQFTADNSWYRAKIRKVNPDSYEVQYVDYGNSETVSKERIKKLDPKFISLAPQANEAKLSFLKCPTLDDEYGREAFEVFSSLVNKSHLKAKVDMKVGGVANLTLFDPEKVGNEDLSSPKALSSSVNAELTEQGYAQVQFSKKFPEQSKVLNEKQDFARSRRLGMFEYGDFSLDENPEL